MRISITSLNDVNTFIKLAQAAEGDITVRKGKFCVDGKSALGVLSLDMVDGVTVEFIPSPANKDFIEFIENFKIED